MGLSTGSIWPLLRSEVEAFLKTMEDVITKDEEVQEETADVVAETPVEENEAVSPEEPLSPEVPENVPYQQPDLIGTPCPRCKGSGLDTDNQRCANCTGTGRII
jgi:hypothetical protein